ncbi:MAG: 16S rRNA (cytosine(967)-C(5))-methyltransferase RsmB [Christensenellales bacterium]
MTDSRKIALEILQNILKDDAYSNLEIKDVLGGSNLDKRDKRFVTALVYGTLERLVTLDYIIVQFTKEQRLHANIRDILRMGVYQIIYMRTGEVAACNESVELAKAVGKEKLSGFVNAVLRNIIRQKDDLNFPAREHPRYLSVRYSYPQALINYWVKSYGFDFVETMLENWQKGGVSLRPNYLRFTQEQFEQYLSHAEISYTKGAVCPQVFHVPNLDIHEQEDFKNGQYSVQSEGSFLAAYMTGVKPGMKVLDLCAAPGGKSAAMAELMNNKGLIVAFDKHEHRVELIRNNAKRLDLTIISAHRHDSLKFIEKYRGMFDAVLLDAPCSGLGVSGKPELRYRYSAEKVEDLSKLQKELLQNSAGYVKNGGTLVYSTCTISPLENENVMQDFLDHHHDFILEGYENFDAKMQLFPHKDGEGFFIARMVRK